MAMTEAEWLACTNPQKMLEILPGKVSDRKLQLFACACCRRLWHLLSEERHRQAVEVVERYADGMVSEKEVMRARGATSMPPDDDNFAAATVYTLTAAATPYTNPYMARVADYACHACSWDGNATNGQREDNEKKAQVHLLRCIVGNLPRPVAVEPAWQTSLVVALAHANYDNRLLPAGTLDPARLAVLADALEEAGCYNADILNHCRQSGEHVRGCWVVDSILGFN
jgi:transposase-like protein